MTVRNVKSASAIPLEGPNIAEMVTFERILAVLENSYIIVQITLEKDLNIDGTEYFRYLRKLLYNR